jgi:undecaprenyl-diphosphatase
MLVNLLQGMDNGAYYFFRHKASHYPELEAVMQVGDALGSLFLIGVLAGLAVLLFLVRGESRSAGIATGSFVVGLLLVEALHYLIPGRRPEDAQNLLGSDEMLHSFPARSVFLLTLAGILFLYALGPSLQGRWMCFLMTTCVVVLVLWVCLSQLLLGLHFVTDVLAGLAGGLALGLLGALSLAPPAPQTPATG